MAGGTLTFHLNTYKIFKAQLKYAINGYEEEENCVSLIMSMQEHVIMCTQKQKRKTWNIKHLPVHENLTVKQISGC